MIIPHMHIVIDVLIDISRVIVQRCLCNGGK